MKTGLIVEADVTDKGLNNFSVKRTHVKGEDWVSNRDNNFNLGDAQDWIDLMVEGIVTVIYNAHDSGMKDSAEFLRETIDKMSNAFAVPAKTGITKNDGDNGKEYKESINTDLTNIKTSGK